MRKWKIGIAVILSLSLILAGAFLPEFFSSVTDKTLSKTPSYTDMPSIQLNISKAQQFAVLDKLALLGTVETANAVPAQMTMSEAQAVDAANAFMRQYENAGLLQPAVSPTVSATPKLLYDLTDPSNYLFVWTVSIICEAESCHQYFLCDVDDQTGQILCLSYDIYKQPYEPEGVRERNRAAADTFTSIYFEQLGLTGIADAIKLTSAGEDGSGSGALYVYTDMNDGITEVTYTFESPTFGSFHIQFHVDGSGSCMLSIFK